MLYIKRILGFTLFSLRKCLNKAVFQKDSPGPHLAAQCGSANHSTYVCKPRVHSKRNLLQVFLKDNIASAFYGGITKALVLKIQQLLSSNEDLFTRYNSRI